MKNVRKGVEHLYFKILQDVEGEIIEDTLFLCPKTKASYDMLSKDDVIKKYGQIVSDLGFGLDVRCEPYYDEYEDTTEKDIKELSKIFGTDIQIK